MLARLFQALTTMGFFFLDRHKPPGTVKSTVGISSDGNQDNKAFQEFSSVVGRDLEKGATSFSERVRRDYRWHTAQYWFVATLANGLLWAQIVIGAALTALGATHTPQAKTATIYLGASSTVIAGLLTYFKSRNQPNRARQFRQALRGVRNKMDEAANEVTTFTTPEEARQKAQEIIKQYDEALADAAVNYPDLWVSIADLRKFLPKAMDDLDKSQSKPKSGPHLTSGGHGGDEHPGGDAGHDEHPSGGSHPGPVPGGNGDQGGDPGDPEKLTPPATPDPNKPLPPHKLPKAVAPSLSPSDAEVQEIADHINFSDFDGSESKNAPEAVVHEKAGDMDHGKETDHEHDEGTTVVASDSDVLDVPMPSVGGFTHRL